MPLGIDLYYLLDGSMLGGHQVVRTPGLHAAMRNVHDKDDSPEKYANLRIFYEMTNNYGSKRTKEHKRLLTTTVSMFKC
ncbi:hypothetical protein NPIL_37291 [Nephila pilipes]|uniref:Uncharacterized protein n=1 Tax=Nephila pilipes TaxID=299642 RepID=A0A8X6PZW4_NEPPI|nr:hypothetical protein NPIL_37291 [Nephila pilipes]